MGMMYIHMYTLYTLFQTSTHTGVDNKSHIIIQVHGCVPFLCLAFDMGFYLDGKELRKLEQIDANMNNE